VQTDRGFVLHNAGGQWQSTLQVNDKIELTTSKDILQAVGAGTGPRNLLVTLGYAGWSEGQLEQELAANAWLSVLATEHILFDLPAEEKLAAAMALLGVDYASLSEEAGHA
jgi:putative transcriptional regulator